MKGLAKEGFEYFYNNYCKRDGMPEYSEEVFQDYLKMAEEARYRVGYTRRGKNIRMYPLTPNKAFKYEQCVYCGDKKPQEEMKEYTFVAHEEFKEWICKDEKCLKL
jgi:hypothetical protein